MDEEEIKYPMLYDIRQRCENLMSTIEKSYTKDKRDILARFVRFSANKREFNNLAPKKSGAIKRGKTMANG
jgi:hypothetical protein